jgi:short subunit dehydrogenase-like uncharacterized protein
MAANREFDIVVWGATGFVGRRVSYQLASRFGSNGNIRWAIGGRNRAKLEAVRAELGSVAKDIPIVLGDNLDTESMAALASRAKVIASTVGPFAKYGSQLVAASVANGTHYCDIAAEVHWIKRMIDAHQTNAEKFGARIVNACGFDSIPSDLGVLFLQHEAKRRFGQRCPHIRMRVQEMKGGLNGGTAASFIYASEQGPRDPSIVRTMEEPYSLNPDGERQGPELPQSIRAVRVQYDGELESWTMPFFMAPMNTKIVRRTNALLGYPYGMDFRYEEAIATGDGPLGFLKAMAGSFGFSAFMYSLAFSPTRRFLKKYVLPKPGEGPDKSARECGHWDIVLLGKPENRPPMRARVRGEGDPNTEATSIMLTESAVCLAQDSGIIDVGGGFWTPGSAMGELLLVRLIENAGIIFEIEDNIVREIVQPISNETSLKEAPVRIS